MKHESTFELLLDLLKRPSITPSDEGCQEVIIKRLKKLGFHAEYMRFENVDNIWLRYGTEKPLVCFAGHTDVVPTGKLQDWTTPPFEPTIRDGKLFARGSADMKASIACFVVAVEELFKQHKNIDGSIALLLTSDEEGPSINGTVKVVETLKARHELLDYCIVGEPTCTKDFGDTIKNGRRGSLTGDLRIKGVQGHVAYPHLAKNPTHLFAPALAELASIEWDKGNEYFPPTTWQVSNIHAGVGASNVIPADLTCQFNFRFSTASTVDGLKNQVEDILKKHKLDYKISWTLSGNPFLTPKGNLVDALSKAILKTTKVVTELSTDGGTSDGRFIANICPQVVEFGPKNASIHKIDEHVELETIDQLTDIYKNTLENLFIN